MASSHVEYGEGEYEAMRAANIKRNQEIMRALGLVSACLSRIHPLRCAVTSAATICRCLPRSRVAATDAPLELAVRVHQQAYPNSTFLFSKSSLDDLLTPGPFGLSAAQRAQRLVQYEGQGCCSAAEA